MARRLIPHVPKGRPRSRYPNGWPKNLRATLYLNDKDEGPVPFVIGAQLQENTMIYETTEMSNYG